MKIFSKYPGTLLKLMSKENTKPLMCLFILIILSTEKLSSASDCAPPPKPWTRGAQSQSAPPMVPRPTERNPSSGDHKITSEKLFISAIRKHAHHNLKGAIADYLTAMKSYDKAPAVHWYLGTAYQEAGLAAKAQREFETELEMNRAIHVDSKEKRSYPAEAVKISPIGDFGSNSYNFIPSEGLRNVNE